MSALPVNDDEREAALLKLGSLLREENVTPSAVELAQGFDDFSVHRRGLARRRVTIASTAGVIAVAAAVLFAVGLRSHGLTLCEGAQLASDGHLTTEAGSQLTFSDGSEVKFAARSSGRLLALNPDGARLRLENGSVSVHVVPGPGKHWMVEAGPFEVAVHGTRFDVAWRPDVSVLDVDLQEGSVSVSGPLAKERVQLRAGERLTATAGASFVVASTRSAKANSAGSVFSAVASEQSRTGAGEPSAAVPAVGNAAGSATLSGPRRSWTELIRVGEFDAVLRQADARGIETVLSQAGTAELSALADSARYRGRSEVAFRALVALRKRFPSSAAGAAFELGRMAEARGDLSTALTWYDTYLAEAPSGALGAEALGRRMMLRHQSGSQSAAETDARSYLGRYTKGPYARQARDILCMQ